MMRLYRCICETTTLAQAGGCWADPSMSPRNFCPNIVATQNIFNQSVTFNEADSSLNDVKTHYQSKLKELIVVRGKQVFRISTSNARRIQIMKINKIFFLDWHKQQEKISVFS